MVVVHAADLHLDSPMRALERYAGAEEIRGATRRAFENVVELCVRERAVALLLAGDVFDGTWHDFRTALYFLEQLGRLRPDTRVYVVRGNHDHAAHGISRHLRPPDHVHIFSHDKAETVVDETHGLAVHGMSYARADVRESLLPFYPPPCAGLVNFGLLHTNAVESTGHARYAPTNPAALEAHGYDYWALGHVHDHVVVRPGPRWIVYPGNPQGRSVREVGPRGCVRVEIDDDTRQITQVEPVAVDVARWARATVEVGDATSRDEVRARVSAAIGQEVARADGRIVGVQVVLAGTGEGHEVVHRNVDELRQQLRVDVAHHGGAAWLEAIRVETRPAVLSLFTHGLAEELGQVARTLAADPERLLGLLAVERAALHRIMKDIGPQADEDTTASVLDPTQPEALLGLLVEAQDRARRALSGEAG